MIFPSWCCARELRARPVYGNDGLPGALAGLVPCNSFALSAHVLAAVMAEERWSKLIPGNT
eukprot:9081549-Alexandrium_andersonii.AAC.1